MKIVSGRAELRYKDGTVFRFLPRTATLPFIGSTLESITDANGNTVTLERDAARGIRINAIVDPVGRRLTLTYDGTDRITSLRDPIGRIVRYRYHAAGTLESVTDPAGGVTRYEYDVEKNRLTRVTNPRGVVIAENSYDSNDRVITQRQADGGLLQFAYTLLNPTVGTSQVIRTVVTDPLGRTTRYRFSPESFLTDVTDALEQTRVFEREAGTNLMLGIEGSGSCPSCGATTAGDQRFTYDGKGNLLTRTDANDHTTSFAYDNVGLLTETTDPLGAETQFAYDRSGDLTSVTDAAGRLLETTNGVGTVEYAYDAADRVNTRTVAGQSPLAYTYDPTGNLVRAALPEAAADFRYDARDELSRLSRSNGVTSDYTYDPVGRVLSITHAKDGLALNTQSYGYDALGNRSSQATDIAQPLQTGAVQNDYDAANRLLRSGDKRYTYDQNGNLTSESGPQGTTTYAWDARNRLEAITTPAGGTLGFVYDFAGNLIRKTTVQGGLTKSEDFVLDDVTNIAYQSDSDGGQFAVLAGRGIDAHLAIVPPDGDVEFGLEDAINSTVATSDPGAAIKSQFLYEPYGDTTAVRGGEFPFQYTGRVPVTADLHYYRAKIYDAGVGRLELAHFFPLLAREHVISATTMRKRRFRVARPQTHVIQRICITDK